MNLKINKHNMISHILNKMVDDKVINIVDAQRTSTKVESLASTP